MIHPISRRRRLMAATASATVLALPALLLSSGTATAQSTSGGSTASNRIEEVVVTARSKGESVQNVPIAMTAITVQLNSADVRDIRDIVAFTPNVRIDSIYQRSNSPSINIRGISPSRTDDNSIDSPIGVLIDGIYLGSLPGQIIDNFDLERVEILRGPQGTLFGRNTIGGALNVIRSKPTGEWGAKVQYTTGKWNQQEFRGVLNLPVIKDTLAAKVFFFSANRDGYLRNTFLDINQPQKDYNNYGVVLKYTPNDRIEALLTVEKFDDKSQGGAFLGNFNVGAGVLPVGTRPSDFNTLGSSQGPGGTLSNFLPGVFGLTNTPARTDLSIAKTISPNFTSPGLVQTSAYTLNATGELNDNLRLVSVTGYRKQHEKYSEDFDGSSTDLINIETDARYDQFSQELRLEGDWDSSMGKISFVAGGYYFENHFTRNWVTSGDFWEFVSNLGGYSLARNAWLNPALATATGFANPVQACNAPRVTPGLQAVFGRVRCDGAVNGAFGPKHVAKLFEEQDTEAVAGFFHADWELLPKLTLTVGLRYTWEQKDFTGYQAYQTPLARVDVFAFPDSIRLKNSWKQTTPMAALAYKMTPDILLYGSYSEGWHSGGFFGVNQNTQDFAQNQYDPETAQSYEIGMKGQFFDNTVQLNLATFRNDFTNKQESAIVFDDTTNTVVTLFTNVGGLRYQGFEAELQWVVNQQLSLAASFGYLDAKYTNLLIGFPGNKAGPVPIVNATFLEPRNAPKYTAGGSATYTMPLGPGDLTLGSKVTWVDATFGDIYNTTLAYTKSHTDLSASVSYNYENYTATLFGRNLTGWRREAGLLIAPLFGASTITPGRSWGVEIAATF